MQQMLIKLSHQDQVFIEEECFKHGYTYETFLIHLLELYKERSQSVSTSEPKQKKKTIGRPKKDKDKNE